MACSKVTEEFSPRVIMVVADSVDVSVLGFFVHWNHDTEQDVQK
jgi:hypothetical protein